MNRKEAIGAIRKELESNLKFATDRLHRLREGLGEAEESAMGDTHETGRTLIEEQIQIAEVAKVRADAAMDEFEKSVANPPNDHVSLGNMVTTDRGIFFVGPALGKIEEAGKEFFTVSLESPVGRAILGAVPGDEVEFQGGKIIIKAVG